MDSHARMTKRQAGNRPALLPHAPIRVEMLHSRGYSAGELTYINNRASCFFSDRRAEL